MRYILLVVLSCSFGCRDNDSPGDPDAGTVVDAPDFPPPKSNVVPPVGTDSTIDIATWNIENFPQNVQTPSHVADLITSMALDVIVTQEIADQAAFQELDWRLDSHEMVLSSHEYRPGEYQKIGLLYRPEQFEIVDTALLFTNDNYLFPRPPYQVTLREKGSSKTFLIIGIHLKAGIGGQDRDRRRRATNVLEAYVAQQTLPVLVAGDFNEIVTSFGGKEAMAAWFDGDYGFVTEDAAAAGEVSFLPGDKMIDHFVGTPALVDGVDSVEVAPLQEQFLGYESDVSDHLPVTLRLSNL